MPFYKQKIVFISTSIFVIFGFFIWSCNQQISNHSSATSQIVDIDSTSSKLASVIQRQAIIEATLQKEVTIIPLPLTEANEINAQHIFLTSTAIFPFLKNENNEKLLNEIFTVRKALPSDVQIVNPENCYRIEMYNFTYNSSIVAIVNLTSKSIVELNKLESSAPDLPEHLKKIAVDIAIHSPQVKTELGDAPEIKDAQMAYTKTALNNSKCERSLHLCVAPTFVQGKKALWSIVDLTDLKLVGTRWTNVGDAGPVRVSERKLQNEKISECFCEQENSIDKNGWKMQYNLTSSDGLRIAGVTFKNKKILRSAKLVDWHVSYSNSDGFGYSDGIGCPIFSLSAVTAWDAPKIIELSEGNQAIGFVLEQIYKSEGWPAPCNYNYVQRYEFYNDGKFRISAASIGRGCGNDGTYRPVLRIAFEGKNSFSEYDGINFKNWSKENWTLQKENTRYDANGYAYKINGNTNYFVEPSKGQFKDKGRGDNAFVYITKYKSEEGENDLVTNGTCCNFDYHQGPEKFIEPNAESLQNDELVLWYVPQMKNDNTKGAEYCWAEAKVINGKYTTISYPCFAGPMFVPNP
jgi:hypothetical protein